MKRFLYLLPLLPGAVLGARAGTVAAASEATRIIMPGAQFGQTGESGVLPSPLGSALLVSAPPSIIIPDARVILPPAAGILTAVRPLTEQETSPEKALSRGDLMKLAESLAPTRDALAASEAGLARSLDAAFDGKLAPEASAWDDVSEQFARGPLAPGLPAVEAGARSIIARLLPSFYRRVPTSSAYDRGAEPASGHIWTPEKGHLIEIAPVRPDSRGEVPSFFGAPGQTRVQQKIEHLMEYAHEYFHVLFDSGVRRKEIHPAHSVYSAMTEGFAVSGEQLLIERLLDTAPSLNLGPRDTLDLAAISRARRQWLDVEDNHYSEGILSWRKAYEEGGSNGILSFLAALSARRMIVVPRSDPAYQLVLGDPKLLSDYLGRDPAAPARRGLEAFVKAAQGEKLTDEEARESAAAVDQAGPDGWRRLFDRTLLADKRIKEPKAVSETGKWWKTEPEPMASVEPVFALARLSPSAAAALARYLADTIASPRGAARLFERPGPNEKLNAIVAGAESLPWDETGRAAWNDGLMRWMIGAN